MLHLVQISNPGHPPSKFAFSLAVEMRIGLSLGVFLLRDYVSSKTEMKKTMPISMKMD